MKRIFILLFSFFSIFFYLKKSFASHIAGNIITYEYVGINQYHLSLKYYKTCPGIPVPSVVNICYESTSSGFAGSVTLNLPNSNGTVLPVGPCYNGNGLSNCQGGNNFGVEEYIFQGMVTLPNAADDWLFTYSDCCLAANFNTLQSSISLGTYCYAKLDNLNFPINSSAQFNSCPFNLYCLNVLSTYEYSTFDPDGDSLVFELINPERGGGCPTSMPVLLIYNSPYSATYPLSSSTPVLFNSSNGNITFTPDLIQWGLIAMKVKEFRNGILIGEVKREDIIIILNGTTAVFQIPPDVSDLVIYPNPATGILNIELNLKAASLLKIQLYNTLGAVEKNIENSRQTGLYKKQFDLMGLSKGIYFLKATTQKDNFFVKVILQ